MANFPTFSSRNEYMRTEGLELAIPVGIVIILLLLLGLCYCVPRYIYLRRKDKNSNTPKREQWPSLGQDIHFALQYVLSSAFDIIEIVRQEKETTKPPTDIKTTDIKTTERVLLFAKRRRPKNMCCYALVLLYFIILLVGLFLLLVCLFFNLFIYRKTSTCNDINVKTEYSVCFDINHGYARVNCTDSKNINDPNLEVICYLTDWGFFRALGVSFGAIQAVRALIFVLFPIGITIGRKSICLIIVFQSVSGLIIVTLPILLYCLFYVDGLALFTSLYGDPPLVHASVWIACATAFAFVVCLPWWAFHPGWTEDTSAFEQVIRKGNVSYVEWKTVHVQPPKEEKKEDATSCKKCVKCMWYPD